MQRQRLKEILSNADDQPLFSDTVRLQDIGEHHELLSETDGQITAYADRLEICGNTVPFTDVLGMTIYSRNVLVIHTISGSRHFEIRSGVSFSALKYLYLYEIQKSV